jgi:hypothetical protein
MTQTVALATAALMRAEDRRNDHSCVKCQEDRHCQTFHNLTDKYAQALEKWRKAKGLPEDGDAYPA